MATQDHRLRVLYIAIQMVDYPRNSRIRNFLESKCGAEVTLIHLSRGRGFLKHCRELLWEGIRAKGPFDMVILSELSLAFAAVSWLVSKRHRAAHIVDFFVGLHETQVEDRGVVSAGSVRGRALRALDRLAERSADLILSDTDVRSSFWARFGTPALTLPVGAPPWAVQMAPSGQGSGATKFLYYGNYIPLHGVVPLMDAFRMLSTSHEFHVTMIGTGDHRRLAEHAVKAMKLGESVTFLEPVAESELGGFIASHDVVLGIFGTSPKAAGVIANKVWQGLACGRTVVTRQSEALMEIRPIVDGQLLLTEGGNAESIHSALESAIVARGLEYRAVDVDLEGYVERRYSEFSRWIAERQSLSH